jgi:S1-C subfamily serine protease
MVLNIISHIFAVVVTIILAFSPRIASFIGISPLPQKETGVVTIPAQSTPPSFLEAFGDTVRTQLQADERYQQARVVESTATSSPVSKTSIEAALVNIFCTARGETSIRTVTGSGVFIDTRGVILTNAHIAQFLLLAEEAGKTKTQCVIRQGSPAVSKYEADLLYVSPAWITKNAYQLSLQKPSGTGEQDFALLYVTGALGGSLPATFLSLTPSPQTDLFSSMKVRAAGYPAEMLTTDNTRAALVPIVASTSIRQLFTFGSGKIDLVAIAPSTVGKQGSSGGPLVAEDGSIVGLIVTRGNTQEEGAQSLRALTLGYIDRTLTEETGLDLARTLSGNITLRAKVFHETVAPYLRELLLDTSATSGDTSL